MEQENIQNIRNSNTLVTELKDPTAIAHCLLERNADKNT